MKTRVLGQPSLDLGMLVRGVVITNQVQRFVLGRFPLDLAQEFQPLGGAMPSLALANHVAIQDIESGKQCSGTVVTLVVMGHRRRSTAFQRQPWLGAIQRLDLAFFSRAQD